MKFCCDVASRLILVPALFLASATLATPQNAGPSVGSISGILEDSSARPLAGVPLEIANDLGTGAPAHTTTGAAGEYTFGALPPGRYRIFAEQPGIALSPAGVVTITSDHPLVRLSLTLSHTDATQTPSATPDLNLKAAGIRGYIDPGGYSAPAGAAAATNLVRGIADLKRTDNLAGEPESLSCAAQASLLRTTADHPGDGRASQQLGTIYLAQHQPALALPNLQRAWDLDPAQPQVSLLLSDALIQTGHFQAAQDLLIHSQTDARSTVQGHRLLARANEGLGNFLDASDEYQAAIQVDPTEQDYFGAGYEQVLAGSPQAGGKLFQAGLERFPESTTLLVGIGTVQFLSGNSASATRTFLQAVERNPADPRPYHFLFATFQVSGLQPDTVQASFQRFYRLMPDNAEAAYFYALSLAHSHPGSAPADPQQIELLLQRSVQLDPRFAEAHVQLGSLYDRRGNYPRAVAEYETALHLDPALWEVHYRLSAALRRVGDQTMADRHMKLFQTHRSKRGASGPASTIRIEEFLSVFNRSPRENGQSSRITCPATASR